MSEDTVYRISDEGWHEIVHKIGAHNIEKVGVLINKENVFVGLLVEYKEPFLWLKDQRPPTMKTKMIK